MELCKRDLLDNIKVERNHRRKQTHDTGQKGIQAQTTCVL